MKRIAVIDDNEAWCFIMETLLEQRGFAVSTFPDAHTFLLKPQPFDMVLVDFSLPPRSYQKETNGPDLIQQLKENLDRPPLLVLVSAYFTPDSLAIAQEICPEADAWLSKSMGSEEILKQVEQLLTHSSAPSRLRRHAQIG